MCDRAARGHRSRDRGGIALAIVVGLEMWLGKGTLAELLQTAILIGGLCDRCARLFDDFTSHLKLRLWKHSFESLECPARRGSAGVNAAGAPGSAVVKGCRRLECRRDLKMTAAARHIFDGVTSARRPVLVELGSDGVLYATPRSATCWPRWPDDELDQLARPKVCCARPPRRQAASRGSRCAIRCSRRPSMRLRCRSIRSGAGERRGGQGGRLEPSSTASLVRAGIGCSGIADRSRRGAAARGTPAWRGGEHAGAQDARQGQANRPFECAATVVRAEGRAALVQA